VSQNKTPCKYDLFSLAVVMGLYHLFKSFDQATLHALEEQTQISLVGSVRDYLTSGIPNETYLFLSCLECVDPGLWSGASENIPAALEAREVEQIMQFLDSNDDLMRKKVCKAEYNSFKNMLICL